MQQQSWWSGVFVLRIPIGRRMCHAGIANAYNPRAAQQTIPADSPLAKIREGMSKGEMIHLLGQPTDQETTLTGKAFIPFYFGGDETVTRMHYQGLGRIYMSGEAAFGGGEQVLKIEYDPQESGFRK